MRATDVAAEPRNNPPTLTLDCGGGVQMELVLIPAGTFTMGSIGLHVLEEPPHGVTISKQFYMGRYAVTQEQWQAVTGRNPSHFAGAKNPVDFVSWNDCQEFIEKLKKKFPQYSPALPTEAQWECACRAGSTGAFCFGDNESELGEYAWFRNNADQQTHPVGQKKANAWGLYDMHGNVWEWCADWCGKYSTNRETDPTGTAREGCPVTRGGAWIVSAADCRSSYRNFNRPDRRSIYFGFRLALDPN